MVGWDGGGDHQSNGSHDLRSGFLFGGQVAGGRGLFRLVLLGIPELNFFLISKSVDMWDP